MNKSKYNLCGSYDYFHIFKGSFCSVRTTSGKKYQCVVEDSEHYGCFGKEKQGAFYEEKRPVKISEATYYALKSEIIKIAKMENLAIVTMATLFGCSDTKRLLNRL